MPIIGFNKIKIKLELWLSTIMWQEMRTNFHLHEELSSIWHQPLFNRRPPTGFWVLSIAFIPVLFQPIMFNHFAHRLHRLSLFILNHLSMSPVSIDLLVLFCWVCLICFQFASASLGFSESPLKLSLEKDFRTQFSLPKVLNPEIYKLSLSPSLPLSISLPFWKMVMMRRSS
jgi:hypothetical protein